jgi:hypothetical protein
MSSRNITVLADGSLYALQNVIELDGRVSSYPANASGYSVSNCYLIKHGDRALLLDSGYSVHRKEILAQLETLLEPDTSLSLFPLRLNEYMSVCNVESIAERFNVEQCYASNPDAARWVDFGGLSDSGGQSGYSLKTRLVGRAETLFVGREEQRPLDAFQAPIRLIGTRWMYDRMTRTLFTSDSFSHEWSQSRDGPWTTTASDSTTTAAHMRSFLLNTRYWWLEGGSTSSLRSKLAGVFEKYEIENIAPGYGRILCGKEIVARQYQLLDDVLRSLDKSTVHPEYVYRDDVR